MHTRHITHASKRTYGQRGEDLRVGNGITHGRHAETRHRHLFVLTKYHQKSLAHTHTHIEKYRRIDGKKVTEERTMSPAMPRSTVYRSVPDRCIIFKIRPIHTDTHTHTHTSHMSYQFPSPFHLRYTHRRCGSPSSILVLSWRLRACTRSFTASEPEYTRPVRMLLNRQHNQAWSETNPLFGG